MNFFLWWWCLLFWEFKVEQTSQLQGRRQVKGLCTHHPVGDMISPVKGPPTQWFPQTYFLLLIWDTLLSYLVQAAPEPCHSNASFKCRYSYIHLLRERVTLPCLTVLHLNISKHLTMPPLWRSLDMDTFVRCYSHLNHSKTSINSCLGSNHGGFKLIFLNIFDLWMVGSMDLECTNRQSWLYKIHSKLSSLHKCVLKLCCL